MKLKIFKSHHGKKGTPEEEIKDAAKRMKKYPEHLRSAKTSKLWQDFLLNIGINPKIIGSQQGERFWQKVRKEIRPALSRTEKYAEARQAGVPSKLARKVRDWSETRLFDFITNWQSKA